MGAVRNGEAPAPVAAAAGATTASPTANSHTANHAPTGGGTRGGVHRLSVRSVLLPTSTITASSPRSVRTCTTTR